MCVHPRGGVHAEFDFSSYQWYDDNNNVYWLIERYLFFFFFTDIDSGKKFNYNIILKNTIVLWTRIKTRRKICFSGLKGRINVVDNGYWITRRRAALSNYAIHPATILLSLTSLPYQGRGYKTEIREKIKKRDVRKKKKLRLCSVREFPYALDSILPRTRFSGVWIFKFGRFNSYERGKRMKQNQAQLMGSILATVQSYKHISNNFNVTCL